MTSTSGLTRPIHRFQTAGATGDRLACPVAEELNSVAHNKQTGEVSPGLGLRFCLSCVISLLVLTAIVHSWVILACVLTGQFSSAHPGPLHRWRKVNNWILYSKKKKKKIVIKNECEADSLLVIKLQRQLYLLYPQWIFHTGKKKTKKWHKQPFVALDQLSATLKALVMASLRFHNDSRQWRAPQLKC